jgi:hypothetical protein
MTLAEHITQIKAELDSPLPSKQRRRHLEDELFLLLEYEKNHPNDDYDPNSLELYCDKNPEALECKIFNL